MRVGGRGRWLLAVWVATLLCGALVSAHAAATCDDFTLDRAGMAYLTACALAGGEVAVPTGPATPTYSDVPVAHWAYRYIEYVVAQHMMSGYPDGSFHPTLQVTRDQAAVYVARVLAGGDANVPQGPATPTFADVGTDYWSYKYVEYLNQHVVDAAYSTSPLMFAPTLPMSAFTAASWLEQGTGVTLDPCRAVGPPTGAPAADFSATPTSGLAPLTVAFTDLSTNAPTSWQWSFGEVGTSIQQNPSHQYATPGSYTVSLTVTNAVGSDTETKADYITVLLPPPGVDFTATPLSGIVPLTVTFTDTSTGAPTSWAWDFGDGATATAQNPTHEYTALGNYSVSLTATNAGGSDTETKSDYITVLPPPPVADFTATPLTGVAPLTVTFTDASTGAPASWVWDFGDGGTAIVPSPTHEYQRAGAYTVSLTVTNAGGGNTKTQADYITATFTDVGLDFWATDAILACLAAGIVNGYPDGSYGPTLEVTRDQMAVYVSRALANLEMYGFIPDFGGEPSFPDVGKDHWALKYVEFAKAWNIVAGYPDGTYGPGNAVDRGQMAVYIARAIADPTGEVGLATYTPPITPNFSDVGTDYYAYKYIEYIKGKSVAGGYPDGTYQPALVVTRDQMAVYVARAFKLM